MADLWLQGITIEDNKDPAPEKNPFPVKIPVTQLEDEKSWISEGIIYPRRSNDLHNTNAAFKNYTCEEVIKMMNLELFLILFPVNYLKYIITHKTNKLLKHTMDLGEFILWMGCWFYMV